MREFSIIIKDSLTKGLRKYNKADRMKFQLYKLQNLKSNDFGLVPYEPVINPIPLDILGGGAYDLDFPFPQLFIGKKFTFLAYADAIFYVDRDDWSSLYQLTTYDAADTSTEKDITKGGLWHFIDFWDFWLMTNGVCSVFGSARDTMIGNTLKTYVSDDVPISCGCDHKGRTIFGGFDYNNFWSSSWKAIWNTWITKNQDTGLKAEKDVYADSDVMMPVEDNWIWWSSIGGGDVLDLFFPAGEAGSGLISSDYDSTSNLRIFDILKMNQQGFAPMPFQGEIYEIKPLGDNYIVYSPGGVAVCSPVSSPAPTMSIKNLELGGIHNKGAVGGNDKVHVYLDHSGTLVQIDANLQVTPLGYREYFNLMLDQDIIINHSPDIMNLNSYGEFYICNPTDSYCLTKNGLNKTKQRVTSSFYTQGATIGFCEDMIEPTDIVGEIGIDAEDFALPGLKTLEWIRLDYNERRWSDTDAIALSVSLDYRYKSQTDESWKSTAYKTVNNEGVVFFPITALEFRINIKITDYSKMELHYVECGVKHTDKRYTRGFTVNPIKP